MDSDIRRGMSKRALTYAQSGVDIDAGNRMVELIKPRDRMAIRLLYDHDCRTVRPKPRTHVSASNAKPLGFRRAPESEHSACHQSLAV